MAKATKTMKQALGYRSVPAAWFVATQALFNQVAAFYFEVIQAHPDVLNFDAKAALTALEQLTHTTKDNPHPVMPLCDVITADIPAMFRRAAIHAALGSARSFRTNLDKWRKRKEKARVRGMKFTDRPPVPPRSWHRSVTLYAGQWKERTSTTIMLKVWTGSSWAWIKCRLESRDLPAEWEMGSAQLVRHGAHWWLHTPLEQALPQPGKMEQAFSCLNISDTSSHKRASTVAVAMRNARTGYAGKSSNTRNTRPGTEGSSRAVSALEIRVVSVLVVVD